jgi:hypothetical protein
LLISPVADLYLSFRTQERRPPSPQDAGMIWLSMGDGILICLRLSDPTLGAFQFFKLKNTFYSSRNYIKYIKLIFLSRCIKTTS